MDNERHSPMSASTISRRRFILYAGAAASVAALPSEAGAMLRDDGKGVGLVLESATQASLDEFIRDMTVWRNKLVTITSEGLRSDLEIPGLPDRFEPYCVAVHGGRLVVGGRLASTLSATVEAGDYLAMIASDEHVFAKQPEVEQFGLQSGGYSVSTEEYRPAVFSLINGRRWREVNRRLDRTVGGHVASVASNRGRMSLGIVSLLDATSLESTLDYYAIDSRNRERARFSVAHGGISPVGEGKNKLFLQARPAHGPGALITQGESGEHLAVTSIEEEDRVVGVAEVAGGQLEVHFSDGSSGTARGDGSIRNRASTTRGPIKRQVGDIVVHLEED